MNFIKILLKFFSFFLIGVYLLPVYAFAGIKNSSYDDEVVSSSLSIPSSLFTDGVKDYYFDLKGGLIFSSAKKIGFYNGVNWDFLSLSYEPVISDSPDGKIFIAAGSVVFSLEVDTFQKYYLSEYARIPIDNKEIIEQLVCFEKGMLIKTANNLYSLEGHDIQKIITNGEDIHIFKTKSRAVIRNMSMYASFSFNSGLGPWCDKTDRYIFFEDHPQGYIGYSETGTCFSVLSPSFTTKNTWRQKCPGTLIDVLHLPNDNYGILTNEHSFYQINSSGKVLSIAELSGINENSKLKISPMDRIWISNSSGFSILDFSLPFQKINLDILKANILSSCLSKGNLFVSDGHALYKFPEKSIVKAGKIHSLSSFNDGFLYVENETLFFHTKGENKQVWNGRIKNYKADTISNKILLELSDKLVFVVPTSSGSFKTKGSIEKSFDQDYSFYDNFLFYNIENRIYRISLENFKTDSIVFSPDETETKIFQILYANNQFLIATQKNIYLQGSDSTQYFDGNRNDIKFSKKRLIPSNTELILSYWIENNKRPGFLFLIFPDGSGEKIRYFPKDFSFGNNQSILRAGEGDYYFVNSDKIYHYIGGESTNRKQFYVLPERIIINGKEIFNGNNFGLGKVHLRETLQNISFKKNSLEMDFSSSDFLSSDIKYQYKLMGRDKEWSAWYKGNNLKLQKLKTGNYLLKLKLANANNYISETFKLNITVLSPIYLSVFAKILYLIFLLIGIFVFYRWYVIRSHGGSDINDEKLKIEAFHKSEPIANSPIDELESISNGEHKKNKWDKYEMVTVLFSDIQGFTKIAEQMNPEKLIDELDQFFFHFDSVVDKYNIEKIKTIGDAYMAAGGIPKRNITNPIEVVLAALEMQQYMKHLKKTRVEIWDLRIGIHSGPVIAGVIGHKKRSYDIWGDSVNIASRMESSGEPGKVNVSGVTYDLIKDFFICEYRGKLPVKYKGNLDMYFVTGLRPELSINLVGLPNKKFFLKLQVKRLNDLEDYVFNKLQEELPKQMYFHNAELARQVYNHSYLISKSENLDIEKTLKVRTASLLLYLGFINNYRNSEVESVNIANEILSGFQYNDRQKNIITNLILSTKPPFEPGNLMEQIMIDAKMEYLGRVDYIKNYKLLFLEENEMLSPKEISQWKLEQIELMENFEYYTAGARRLREISFEEQIERLKKDNQ